MLPSTPEVMKPKGNRDDDSNDGTRLRSEGISVLEFRVGMVFGIAAFRAPLTRTKSAKSHFTKVGLAPTWAR